MKARTILAAAAALALACVSLADSTQKVGGYTYTYSLNPYDGTTGATITNVDPKPTGELSLPSELGTYPVRGIGTRALQNSTGLTRVTMPGSLVMIGRCAFSNCTSLASVTIPDGVKTLYDQPFKDCSSLAKVDMPSSLDGTVTKDNSFSGCRWNIRLYYRWKTGSTTFYYYVVNISGYDKAAYIGFDGGRAVSLGTATALTVPSTMNGHEIIRIDDYAFSGCAALHSLDIPQSVTGIGPYAFKDCTGLESIVLHDRITSIGSGAFQGCSMLARATLPDKLYSDSLTGNQFKDCSASLKIYRVVDAEYDNRVFRVAVNGTEAQVGNGAYASIATNSTGAVAIPSTVKDPRFGVNCTVMGIARKAFSMCGTIESVSVPAPVTSIGASAFSRCYMLGEVTFDDYSCLDTIGEDAFYRCSALTNISLPDIVETIGSQAFRQCASLVDFMAPYSLTTLEYGVFMDCTALKTVALPYGLTTIKDKAFNGCTSLETAYVPKAFLDDDGLATRAFGGAPSTMTIKYCGKWNDASSRTWYYMITKGDSGLFTELGHTSPRKPAVYPKPTGALAVPSKVDGFSVDAIGVRAFWKCDGMTDISFGSTIRYIDDLAFYDCTGLTAVTIPGTVDWLGERVFLYCLNLKDVTIGNGVSTLGAGLFSSCKALTEVTVPASVEKVGDSLFASCFRLKKVAYLGDRPATSGGGNVYDGAPSDLVTIVSSENATWLSARVAGAWEGRVMETEKGPCAPAYLVRYRKYDGSGEAAEELFECGKTYRLAWMDSQLGWKRPGYEFVGWIPWKPSTKARLCKYANGQPVKDLAAAGETVDLWCGWKSSSSYRVCFHRCAGPDDLEKLNQVVLRNQEDSLAWMDSMIGWKREGYKFKGWAEKEGASTVKYANGAKVENLAMDGGTKHLYAVWRANDGHKYPYTVKYCRYDGSGETRTQSFKAGTVQGLLWMDSQLGWKRPGYEFIGWIPWKPSTKARLCRYVNGQKVVDLASTSGEEVVLYAGWKSASSYRVCFHRNDGTDVKLNQVVLRNQEDSLAWMDSMIGWKRGGYKFKGWAESEKGAVKYANGAKVKNLATDGGTKHLYAVWKVAD